MSKVTVPTYLDILWPTLQILRESGGSASNEELSVRVSEYMGLSDKVLEVSHGDRPLSVFDYNSSWARSHLKMIGALDNTSRGVWALTEKGRNIPDDASVREMVLLERKARGQRKRKKRKASEQTEAEVEENISWQEQLLGILKEMDPSAFERLCQRLLREAGFIKVEVLGRTGDGGIDGAGILRVNLLSFHVRFQCKRYRGSVGAPEIRDFRGAFVGRADKGLFITTGRYTTEAEREAVRDGAPPIDLIDGMELCELLKKYKIGVKTELVEEVEPVPSFFESL